MIPIPVYVGRRFMVMVEGSFWQPIDCEHCQLEWAFRVRIGGLGVGKSPYMLDDRGAKDRAAKRARDALEEDQRLAAEGIKRNVACPGCGQYQGEMVRSLRAGHAPSWGAWGWATIVLGSLLVIRGLTGDAAIGGEGTVWLACGAIPIAGGVASLTWRRRLQRRFDPNAKTVLGTAGSPYRQPKDVAAGAGRELSGAPDVITRAQYEAVCAEALAQGTEPPPPIRWLRHPSTAPGEAPDVVGPTTPA